MAESVKAPNGEIDSYVSGGDVNSDGNTSDKTSTQGDGKNMSGQGGDSSWLSLGLGLDSSSNSTSTSGGAGDSSINFHPPSSLDLNKLIIPAIFIVGSYGLYRLFKGA